ncbi:formate dehydrogenase accessory protein [Oceanithermus profundus DSM 14977]|uniref:Formate dehydrogenase accessory protein n=1 Tax=Oceanithermus profundus (strain DSM 14977 / NBRC 100410 / VKM B-2274 / 506) TaxID=670487 RepID=E4U7V8_OCEP5|nr:formate dehydrogenase accessory protein FdhE [Oceanithermus profundus]ADR36557.1 formate dehydrogenase accessory protein [Oceanithermus profundus DSM 14977]
MNLFDLEPLFRSLEALPAADGAAGGYPGFAARFREVLDVIAREQPDWAERARGYRDLNATRLEALRAALLGSGAEGPDDPLLEFALLQTLRRYHRSQDAEPRSEGPDDATCPVCGAEADVAYLDANGFRYAVCRICDSRWPVPRVRCLYCGEEEAKKLEYYPYEAGYRLYRCKSCGRTLPAVDLRETGRLDLPRLRAAAVEMQFLYEAGAVEE